MCGVFLLFSHFVWTDVREQAEKICRRVPCSKRVFLLAVRLCVFRAAASFPPFGVWGDASFFPRPPLPPDKRPLWARAALGGLCGTSQRSWGYAEHRGRVLVPEVGWSWGGPGVSAPRGCCCSAGAAPARAVRGCGGEERSENRGGKSQLLPAPIGGEGSRRGHDF